MAMGETARRVSLKSSRCCSAGKSGRRLPELPADLAERTENACNRDDGAVALEGEVFCYAMPLLGTAT
jgi:hypothetical protein